MNRLTRELIERTKNGNASKFARTAAEIVKSDHGFILEALRDSCRVLGLNYSCTWKNVAMETKLTIAIDGSAISWSGLSRPALTTRQLDFILSEVFRIYWRRNSPRWKRSGGHWFEYCKPGETTRPGYYRFLRAVYQYPASIACRKSAFAGINAA